MSVTSNNDSRPETTDTPMLLDVNTPSVQTWKPDMTEATHNFHVGVSPIAGVGKALYASKFIAKGSYILTFCGPLVNEDEADERDLANFGRGMGNELQIGHDFYVYLEEPGRLINHSCEPNAGIKNDTVLTAIKDIPKGDQIFFDYSTTMDEGDWAMACLCGESTCRGAAADFKRLPTETRAKYLQLGVVQRFIAKQFDAHTGELLCQPAHKKED